MLPPRFLHEPPSRTTLFSKLDLRDPEVLTTLANALHSIQNLDERPFDGDAITNGELNLSANDHQGKIAESAHDNSAEGLNNEDAIEPITCQQEEILTDPENPSRINIEPDIENLEDQHVSPEMPYVELSQVVEELIQKDNAAAQTGDDEEAAPVLAQQDAQVDAVLSPNTATHVSLPTIPEHRPLTVSQILGLVPIDQPEDEDLCTPPASEQESRHESTTDSSRGDEHALAMSLHSSPEPEPLTVSQILGLEPIGRPQAGNTEVPPTTKHDNQHEDANVYLNAPSAKDVSEPEATVTEIEQPLQGRTGSPPHSHNSLLETDTEADTSSSQGAVHISPDQDVTDTEVNLPSRAFPTQALRPHVRARAASFVPAVPDLGLLRQRTASIPRSPASVTEEKDAKDVGIQETETVEEAAVQEPEAVKSSLFGQGSSGSTETSSQASEIDAVDEISGATQPAILEQESPKLLKANLQSEASDATGDEAQTTQVSTPVKSEDPNSWTVRTDLPPRTDLGKLATCRQRIKREKLQGSKLRATAAEFFPEVMSGLPEDLEEFGRSGSGQRQSQQEKLARFLLQRLGYWNQKSSSRGSDDDDLDSSASFTSKQDIGPHEDAASFITPVDPTVERQQSLAKELINGHGRFEKQAKDHENEDEEELDMALSDFEESEDEVPEAVVENTMPAPSPPRYILQPQRVWTERGHQSEPTRHHQRHGFSTYYNRQRPDQPSRRTQTSSNGSNLIEFGGNGEPQRATESGYRRPDRTAAQNSRAFENQRGGRGQYRGNYNGTNNEYYRGHDHGQYRGQDRGSYRGNTRGRQQGYESSYRRTDGGRYRGGPYTQDEHRARPRPSKSFDNQTEEGRAMPRAGGSVRNVSPPFEQPVVRAGSEAMQSAAENAAGSAWW